MEAEAAATDAAKRQEDQKALSPIFRPLGY
jgi:hypothetical protein